MYRRTCQAADYERLQINWHIVFYITFVVKNEKGSLEFVRKMGILFTETKLLSGNVELFANINPSVWAIRFLGKYLTSKRILAGCSLCHRCNAEPSLIPPTSHSTPSNVQINWNSCGRRHILAVISTGRTAITCGILVVRRRLRNLMKCKNTPKCCSAFGKAPED